MKKVILVMTVLFVLATALSTFGVDSANLTGLPDWANIMNAGGGQLKSKTWTVPGNYTFTVPSGVSSVWVTMCGGGGGGSCSRSYGSCGNVFGGGGGGAGAGKFRKELAVTPGTILNITVGQGGQGGVGPLGPSCYGQNGTMSSVTSTALSEPYIALGGSGGRITSGGSYGSYNRNYVSADKYDGNGGNGKYYNDSTSFNDSGHFHPVFKEIGSVGGMAGAYSGGGAAGYNNGGDGGGYNQNGFPGGFCAGGGGGGISSCYSYGSGESFLNGGDGGSGIVKIEWWE